MASKICASVGCKSNATHVLRYSFPESRDVTETELVCQPCGQGYVNRPSLKATLSTIPVKSSGRKRNKLFVWTDVLTDYSSGMIVALAPDVETAIAHVREQGATDTVISEMRGVDPEVHEVTAGNVVVECVYGGG